MSDKELSRRSGGHRWLREKVQPCGAVGVATSPTQEFGRCGVRMALIGLLRVRRMP